MINRYCIWSSEIEDAPFTVDAGLWYPSSRVQTRPKPSDFSGQKKNPQHAFIRKGSKAVCPMS